MKTCVFITGTNCVGKTTLAKEIMKRFGGIKGATNDTTYCWDSRATFAGVYKDGLKHGGVDRLNETKSLAGIVERALSVSDVCFCEGSYFDTFGMNLTNAMFKAQQHLYVFLYAPCEVIHKRLKERSGKMITERIISKQQRTARAANKWQEIGVPVLCFDTSRTDASEIAETIIQKLNLQ